MIDLPYDLTVPHSVLWSIELLAHLSAMFYYLY